MRFSRFWPIRKYRNSLHRKLLIVALVSSFCSAAISVLLPDQVEAQTSPYCALSADAIAQTTALRQAAMTSEPVAQGRYKTQLSQNAEQIRRCRTQSWLKEQAIWLRLYPCDVRAGSLDEIFDRIASRGYGQVYLEVFADGQVLLPVSNNHTAWSSMVRLPGYENRDLLAEAIAKGRERGIKVYAWMFTLNFGYTYGQRPNAQQVLALNGRGYTSLTFRSASGEDAVDSNEAFVDPYNLQAKQDYSALEQAILQRQPDGVLFDYVRYPRGAGSASVASQVQDLWIYGPAAEQALYQRALNQRGLALIQRFISKGYISAGDVSQVSSLYPKEQAPLWQGRTPPKDAVPVSHLQSELWQFTVAHAVQGILDFLGMAIQPVQQRGIPAGAVFFPEANQSVGAQGYDSRLQPWDRFPSTLEWHPMAYGTCGDTSCIVSQVKRVVDLAPPGTQVEPAIAGTWGQTLNGRPALEVQMQAIHQAAPQITSISHFAFSWQDLQYDRDRKFCRL
ncbi:MAG TPA: hypothetical protein V6C57_26085 [Coleofasciculaceae cyanobacterium]